MHNWYVKEEIKDGLLSEMSNNIGDWKYWTSATLLIVSVFLCSMFQLMKQYSKQTALEWK